ncbi:MAG: hypothetical protein LBT01_08380 [Spirochaetaceae bacterium]|jgi:hypothetical protein|nr:hypothetical protein [Spirochaetaceae bacterium]
MKMKKNIFSGLALLVIAAFVFAAAFGSCSAFATDTGASLSETTWISLTPSVPFIDGDGQRAVTLTLDFSKEIDKLSNNPSESDLADIFDFGYDEYPASSEKLKATTISKVATAVYTLKVINVPNVEKGIVLVTIKNAGIAPPTRRWSLDGKVILDAQSAKAANGGIRSEFFAVAKDSSGCTYAVGHQYSDEEYSYGTVRVSGSASDVNNAVIVKYNKSGTALWARSVNAPAGSYGSWFGGVAVDESDRVYVVGGHTTNTVYNYGNNVTVKGSFDGQNAVIVQYDSTGTARWAKSVAAAFNESRFYCVSADASGVYAGGMQSGNGTFSYGAGISVAGSSDSDDDEGGNAVLVKYDSSGKALWAKSVAGAGEGSLFYGVSADGSGKVYAVGSQQGDVAYDYGNGIKATGGGYGVPNAVIVQYDSAGTALWAKSVSGSVGNSVFYAVSTDKLGTLYAAGSQYGTASYNYGGTSVAGSGSLNAVLVKYNSAGSVQWASVSGGGSIGDDDSGGGGDDLTKSVKSIQNNAMSAFTGVAVDKLGKVCVSGAQNDTGVYFYNGASAQGNFSAYNALIVKYNSSTGEAQWAQAPTSSGNTSTETKIKSLFSLPGSEASAAINDDAELISDANASFFYGIAADGLGGFSAVGYQTGNGTFVYGNGTAAQSNGDNNNAVMVEYQ